jgi:diguanylate cyclase (GGDEF)-like protein
MRVPPGPDIHSSPGVVLLGDAAACTTEVLAAVKRSGGPGRLLEIIVRHAAQITGEDVAVLCVKDGGAEIAAAWPNAARCDWVSALPKSWRVDPAAHGMSPIVVDGALWGAITVRTPQPVGGLAPFAGLAALCVADAGPSSKVSATIDPLTGVATHRAFRERLAEEYARAERSGGDLALALFDIDRFKDINNQHGHLGGDEVLKEFGRRLASCARSGDLVARSGGEEFAWIMPGANASQAWEAAERLRTDVSREPMGPVSRVAVSAGICTAAQAGGLDELVRFAEGALYWAKDRGRDAAYVFTPEVVRVLSDDERTQQLSRTHAMRSIRVLARAVDAKDHSTREHSERVADLAVQIAMALGWSMERIAELRDAGLLHDVGKIGIPDAVLLKPGALTDAEYELVKSHPVLGARMASDVLNDEQQAWVRGHHERYDGRGYPDGLAGDDIPEGARILALADSWDVMTSVRSYREAWSMAEALLDCRAESGRQFWPQAVDALQLLYEAGALLVQNPAPAPTETGRPAHATEVS